MGSRRDARALSRATAAATLLAAVGTAAAVEVPERFAGAPAVVLEDTRVWTVDVTGPATFSVRKRILLQSRRGFDIADQWFTYARPEGTLARFEARTVLPNGEIVPVPDDLQLDTVGYKEGDTEYRIVQFTFPSVEVGAIIEWEYEIEREHWRLIRSWTLQRDIPVLETRFTTREKKRKNYSYKIWVYSRTPYSQWCETLEREQVKGYATSEIVCREIPAFRDETWSPPEEDTRGELLFNLGPGWQAPHLSSWSHINEEWSEEIDGFLAEHAAADERAASLVESGLADAEKVDRIYGWVQRNIKLRAVSERIEELHGGAENADELLARGGGTPDHVTMLVLAMLRAVHVDVTPIVVVDRRDGRMVWDHPGYYQADHLMLRVRTDGQTGFLDPACRDCQPGIPAWPYTAETDNGIVIDRMQSLPRKVRVNPAPAEINSERRSERIALRADGTAEVDGEVSWHGQRDVDVRRRWRPLSESARRQDVIRRLPGDHDHVEVTVADPDETTANMSARYSYENRGAGVVAGDRLLIRPPDVFTGKLRFSFDWKRQQAVWLRYAFAVRYEATFTIPEGYRADDLPERFTLEGPGLSFDQAWASGGNPRELKWGGLLIVRRDEFPAEEYPQYLEFVNGLHRALRNGVALRRSEE